MFWTGDIKLWRERVVLKYKAIQAITKYRHFGISTDNWREKDMHTKDLKLGLVDKVGIASREQLYVAC